MRKKIAALLVILFLCLTLASMYRVFPFIPHAGPGYEAKHGVLDLRKSDFKTTGLTRLDGEWEYYPNQLLAPEDFKTGPGGAPPKPAGFVHVPKAWEQYAVNGQKPSAYGYATFRLYVILPAGNGQIYGIKENNIKSSNRMFVNGREIGSSGVPGTNSRETIAANTPYVGFFPVNGNSAEIIIQVANYHDYIGGITHSIFFGQQVRIGYLRQYSIGSDLVVITALLLLGFYYLALFQMRTREYSWLYFGLFCLACSFFVRSHGEKLLALLLPADSYELFSKIQFTSGALSVIFLMLYARHTFPQQFNNSVMTLFKYTYGLGCLVFLFIPIKYFSYFGNLSFYVTFIFILYVIYVMLTGVIQRMEGAVYIMGSVVSILVTAIIMCLDILGVVGVNFLLPFAALPAILFQVFFLSKRFSNAFATVENLSEQLLSMDKLKEEFLANTSHEMKTPLHGMINIAQSLIDGAAGKLNAQQADNMALVVSTGWRAAHLINDILDHSRMKNSELVLQRRAVALRPAVEFVLDMHRHLIKGKEIRLIDGLQDNLPPVDVDEDRLVQILSNLIGNSVKFTSAGEIVISARERNGWMAVSVRDTGIGIPEEHREKIFESYEQAGNSAGQYGGTGLGLSIVRRLVELHGGRIEVESEMHVGSTFTFTLPVSQDAAPQLPDAAEDTVRAKAETATGTETASMEKAIVAADGSSKGTIEASAVSPLLPPAREGAGGSVVIVVDDDLANRQVLINLLSVEGHTVIAAASGEEALRELEKNGRIDLVILDWMMPGMSGGEVCRHIRRRWPLSELPVLMLTARNRPEDRLAGFEAGANDFLGKPVEAGELRARVRTLLEMKKSVAALVETEMAFLRAQIKPHFLFNTLSTIISVSDHDVNNAQRLLDSLSRYLRNSFDFQNREHLVPIDKEMELVQSYLFIEQARFGSRLEVEYQLDVEAQILIPPLSIQPIVENAVRHGIMKREEGGRIRLSITSERSDIIVEIADNGIGMTLEQVETLLSREQSAKRLGVGLPNIHRRLVHHYGEGLRIDSRPGEGTRVRFRVKPYTST